jgi:hypothetical protein
MLLTQKDEEDEQGVQIFLDWLRNGATALIDLCGCDMTDEMLMVIALPMGGMGKLTV